MNPILPGTFSPPPAIASETDVRTTPTPHPRRQRRLRLTAVAAASLLISAAAMRAATVSISPANAAVYAGEPLTLTGTIRDVHNSGQTESLKPFYVWTVGSANGATTPTLSPTTDVVSSRHANVTTTFLAGGNQNNKTFPVTLTLKDNHQTQTWVSSPANITVYALPVATASAPATRVDEGTALVQLLGNGSGSGTLAYQWTAPTGVSLSSATAQNPTFTAPEVPNGGRALTFTLVVTEHRAGMTPKSSAPSQVTVNVDDVNKVPVAFASTSATSIVSARDVAENTSVTLYGTGSDPDGDLLTPTWTQVADLAGAPLPAGATTVELSSASATDPTFDAPNVTAVPGWIDLFFRLTVNDGLANSGPSYVKIRVLNTNDAPTAAAIMEINGGALPANASGNYSVNEGETFTLVSASTDANGDGLTYSWTQVGSSTVLATTPTLTLTAPTVAHGGATFGYQLTVSDGEFSSTATINVTVANVNKIPTADAGADETVPARQTANLDGSASGDGDSDLLSYSWIQLSPGQFPVVLNGAATATPSFTTPTVGPTGAVLTFQLTVNDGYGGIATDTVEIEVSYVNRPPTADAGQMQIVNEGAPVTLNGSGTDPDGNPLTYSWSRVSGPAVTLHSTDSSILSFNAPSVTAAGGVLVMQLTVSDEYNGTATSDVTIEITNVNNAPVANAGGNQNANVGTLVQLEGLGTDEDSEEESSLQYSWVQVVGNGPAVQLLGAGQNRSFTAPPIPNAGGNPLATMALTFELTVTDVNGASHSQTAVVTVGNVFSAPTAVAGGPESVNENEQVTLNGLNSTDPDGDSIATYSWTLVPSGSAIQLHGANTATPTFTAPLVATGASAPVTARLVVTDQWGEVSQPKDVTVSVINSNTSPSLPTTAGVLRASEQILWSPDHRLVPVQILGVQDPDGNATITITGVTQDEPTNGLGDGDTAIDAFLNGTGTALIRAERSGQRDGRVYVVHFTASDFEGTVNGSVQVRVPKGKKTDPAINSGQNHISTQ